MLFLYNKKPTLWPYLLAFRTKGPNNIAICNKRIKKFLNLPYSFLNLWSKCTIIITNKIISIPRYFALNQWSERVHYNLVFDPLPLPHPPISCGGHASRKMDILNLHLHILFLRFLHAKTRNHFAIFILNL